MSGSSTIVVAMSGGVDSSVVAALLKNQGHNVIGIMLTLWSEKGKEASNRCCTPDSLRMAKMIAAKLDIPFYTLDAKQPFFEKVVTPFIQDYTGGLTPNPCLKCNRFIRWGLLYQYALEIGADYLATGHYARVHFTQEKRYQLLQAFDKTKDQSYVLHILGQEELSRTLFPLGELTKTQVRQLAMDYRLPVAAKRDSQDLCFLSGNDYRDFLLRNSPLDSFPQGEIIHTDGTILGTHRGLAFYTIGQRKGLGIHSTKPLYVVAKDLTTNTLIVGEKERTLRNKFSVTSVHWIDSQIPSKALPLGIKVRYRSPILKGTVEMLTTDEALVQLETPYYDITPGQAAVFYDGEICLGGGIIIG